MYIKEIKLQNVKSFDDTTIDFTKLNGKVRKWTAFIGVNGVGKSILLQAITLSLIGDQPLLSDLLPYPNYWVRKGAPMGKIEAIVSLTNSDNNSIYKSQDFHLKYFVIPDDNVKVNGKSILGPRIIPDSSNVQNSRFTDILYRRKRSAVFCSYGPFRRLPSEAELRSNVGSQRFRQLNNLATMFNPDVVMDNIENWMVDLDYEKLKFRDMLSSKMLSKAIDTLSTIIPGVHFAGIHKNRKVMFNTSSGRVPLSELSDGYRSIISWVLNLVMKMIESNPSLKNPLRGEGVVLVDELELHLHPEGQRKIVIWLRKTFPNVQFIVSSHSPFVAQALKKGESFVLKTKGNKTVAEQIEDSFEGWRVDQILTTLFGLETTRDLRTENKLKRYDKLLLSSYEENFPTRKKDLIRKLEKELTNIIPPPGETKGVMQKEAELDEMIKKLKEYESRHD